MCQLKEHYPSFPFEYVQNPLYLVWFESTSLSFYLYIYTCIHKHPLDTGGLTSLPLVKVMCNPPSDDIFVTLLHIQQRRHTHFPIHYTHRQVL